jgi:CHASE2 domain-containing sensor protein
MGQNRKPLQTSQTTSTGIASSQVKLRQYDRLVHIGHILTATWVVLAAMATSANVGLVQIIESETQSLFFEIRGAMEPPKDIVILAIDEQSLSVPEQYYQTNPQQYSYLKPLQAWPWQRRAYALVIDRLMKAGVRSVALDIVFASPSSYGTHDDRAFAQVLQRYPGRVTLAAEYEQLTLRQRSLIQLTQPERLFWTTPMSLGFVNFPVEPDGRIHRFASVFPQLLAEKSQKQFDNFNALKVSIPSFEQAVVAAASLEKAGGSGGAGGEFPISYPKSKIRSFPSPCAFAPSPSKKRSH